MANELTHKDPGSELTQAEYISSDGTGHVFESQAQGDVLYATSTTVLSRLAKDANDSRVLTNTGTNNNPAWAQVTLTTGVTGTLPVGNGGSGATSLTDGGILLGSGTAAVTAMSVLADGEIVVGDGSTDPVALAAFSSSTGTLKVANGGTGASTLTDKAVLISQDSGTDTVGSVALTTSGQLIIGGSSGPQAATLSAGTNVTITVGDGSISIAASGGGDVVCDTSPVLGGSLDASCETILNIGAAGNDILATGVRVINGAACAPSLSFTCDTDTGIYRAGANTIGWTTAGAVGMTLGAEHLTISDGNVIIGTAGHGIDFSASADETGAGSASAELLCDYEEGTWTPILFDNCVGSCASDQASVGYVHQAGYYTKIGRLIHFHARFITNSLGDLTTSHTARIGGLPFVPNLGQDAPYYWGYATNLCLGSASALTGRIQGDDDYIYVHKWSATTGHTCVTIAEWSANGGGYFAGSYFI